jgi:hypothetical protein
VAECALTEPVIQNLKLAFYFGKNSGVLLQKVVPKVRPRNVMNFSCEYGAFRKFGIIGFRARPSFEDRHRAISASVVELSTEPAGSRALHIAGGSNRTRKMFRENHPSCDVRVPTVRRQAFFPVGNSNCRCSGGMIVAHQPTYFPFRIGIVLLSSTCGSWLTKMASRNTSSFCDRRVKITRRAP